MSVDDVEQLLALPPAQRGSSLALVPENQWYERKSSRVDDNSLAKALIGMANAEGGTVVIGLHDGVVEGMRHFQTRVNRLRQVPLTRVAPPVRASAREIPVINVQGEQDSLLVFTVPPSHNAHERSDGRSFVRMGDSTITLDRAQWQEIVYDRSARSYEAEGVGVAWDALDPEQIAVLRRRMGTESDDEHVLRARSLLTLDGRITVAALLLLGRHPQEVMPQAVVRVLRYREDEAGVGARQNMASDGDRRIDGSIPHMIQEARDLMEEWAPRRRALRTDGTFGDVDVIPRDVWLEALVNAVVHRSYSMVGDHVRVSVFPHRIEVSSPGRFPGLADPSKPLGIARYARNPRIARVCADLGVTQELGEGIRRMVSGMRDASLADPTYVQTSQSVIVTLDAASAVPEQVARKLPGPAVEIVGLLRSVGPLGTGDIASGMGIARPTALRALHALRDAGVVNWQGRSPKDPRAVWFVPGAQPTPM